MLKNFYIECEKNKFSHSFASDNVADNKNKNCRKMPKRFILFSADESEDDDAPRFHRKKVKRITETESDESESESVFDEENSDDLAFIDDRPESELTTYSDEVS